VTAACPGTTPEPCCYLAGVRCLYLEEHTVEGRRWACGLRRELGDWAAVHADPRYLAVVRPRWDEVGIVDCGDWPAPGEQCGECGLVGV
jgi:hypothetical protein